MCLYSVGGLLDGFRIWVILGSAPMKILIGLLRDTVGSFPDHLNKASCSLFAGGGACLQFVKNAMLAKLNKTRRACTCFWCLYACISFGDTLRSGIARLWGVLCSASVDITSFPKRLHNFCPIRRV